MIHKKSRLRKETSISNSGILQKEHLIPYLKDEEYYLLDFDLDGDAPKQFIRAYFFEPNSNVRRNRPKTWRAFIAKTASKWYPHESVIEFMLNRIGQVMGLNMNAVRLAKVNGQVRFLSQYFLSPGEKLNHGAEICGQHLGDMEMAREIADHKKTARALFTFEFIRESIREVFPDQSVQILNEIVKMISYDGIVGNNDRHFYNWGVIDDVRKEQKAPRLAPLYDSARGLLWNHSDSRIVNIMDDYMRGGRYIAKYIENAYPRISLESNEEANHFELIGYLKNLENSYRGIINKLASIEIEAKVLQMLSTEFFPFFIPERNKLISLILSERFKKVRDL